MGFTSSAEGKRVERCKSYFHDILFIFRARGMGWGGGGHLVTKHIAFGAKMLGQNISAILVVKNIVMHP